ncbi:unnamed protein product [Protopolystoma xenopodis]|uniref:Uncharacterized protein n=1 Tax=Protopolystoma xenopodis TaxID=117903 RepID=A0A3S5AJS7_9PLAT|nr:unnamed protein product [Protopolystoma xenopodis]
MMRIRMISRNPSDYKRETSDDIFKIRRNYAPNIHPFTLEREYVRATNSAKLEKVMAKPFLGCLQGTTDSVGIISLNPETLGLAVLGTADGNASCFCLMYRFNTGMCLTENSFLNPKRMRAKLEEYATLTTHV